MLLTRIVKPLVNRHFSKRILLGLVLLLGVFGFVRISFASDSVITKVHGEYPHYPKPNLKSGFPPEQIKRGEYLAREGDCIACHTNSKAGGKPFAGGLPIKAPFSGLVFTFYTPNITGDKETGIGSWSKEGFIRAMHEGINPKGQYYFPSFPYLYFTKITKEDLLAIRAYLMSIPAVKSEDKAPQMPWPFSVRLFQAPWRWMFFKEGYYKYNPRESAQWNRGAYLVEGPGHCAMCHSPRNKLGAINPKYELTGGFVEGFYAPNITSYGVVGKSTVHQIVDVFKDYEMLGGGPVKGPMKEVDHDSLRGLTHADLDAIAVYLKSIKREGPSKISASSHPSLSVSGGGKKIYESKCDVCHATGAAGAPKFKSSADWAPFVNKSEQAFKQGRTKGKYDLLYQRAIQGFGSMPPKGTCMSCTNAEIKAAVDYIVSNSIVGAGVSAGKSVVKPPRKLTLADGKEFYGKYCAACHNGGQLGAPKLGDKTAWAPLIKKNMDVLFENVIYGTQDHPRKQAICPTCSDAQFEAAVKYMVEQGKTSGNYTDW